MSIEKLLKWTGASVLALTIACQGNQQPTTEGETAKDTTKIKSGCDLDQSISFSSHIPHEVDIVLQNGYQGLVAQDQPCFDIFSWQSFVALNWPANPDGTPMQGSFTDNPNAPRVWEHYTDPGTLFGSDAPLLLAEQKQGYKNLYMFSKVSHDLLGLPPAIDQATGQPLIDKNLNFAVYEIKLNPDETKYIVDSSLNTIEGQTGKTIDFPAGSEAGSVGAMEIKATWKILVPGVDDTTKFYRRMAVIYVPADQSATGRALRLKEMVGLVAMHIIHKTKNFPFWVWSTFEHIDNAPEAAQVSTAGNNYSFFNPACKDCPQNDTPQFNQFLWAASKPYAGAYGYQGRYGTQVVRENPVYGPTETVNRKWQAALTSANSVFANYRVIGSQWAVVTETFPADTIAAPDTLANTTLETYIQNGSCIGTCHQFATDAVGNSADFSFVLEHARAAGLLNKRKKAQ